MIDAVITLMILVTLVCKLVTGEWDLGEMMWLLAFLLLGVVVLVGKAVGVTL